MRLFGENRVSDVSQKSMRFRYIHTDEAKLTPENVNDILYLAKKYMVEGLCEKVSSFVKENLDGSNIFDFLDASTVYAEYEKM